MRRRAAPADRRRARAQRPRPAAPHGPGRGADDRADRRGGAADRAHRGPGDRRHGARRRPPRRRRRHAARGVRRPARQDPRPALGGGARARTPTTPSTCCPPGWPPCCGPGSRPSPRPRCSCSTPARAATCGWPTSTPPTGAPAVTYTRGRPTAGQRRRRPGRRRGAGRRRPVAGAGRACRRPRRRRSASRPATGCRPRTSSTARSRSGSAAIFVADRPGRRRRGRSSTELLHPVRGRVRGRARAPRRPRWSRPSRCPTCGSPCPADDLTQRVVFTPQPALVRWRESAALEQAVVSLQASAGLARGDLSWDSLLDRVLGDGRAAGRVRPRPGPGAAAWGCSPARCWCSCWRPSCWYAGAAGSVSMARERGASLLGIAGELLVEALVVAAAGAAVGLARRPAARRRRRAGAGRSRCSSWPRSAAPVLGAVAAARADRCPPGAGQPQRPAYGGPRRGGCAGSRSRPPCWRRPRCPSWRCASAAWWAAGSGGDLTAASAPTWWAVAGALVVLRLLPPAVRLRLRRGAPVDGRRPVPRRRPGSPRPARGRCPARRVGRGRPAHRRRRPGRHRAGGPGGGSAARRRRRRPADRGPGRRPRETAREVGDAPGRARRGGRAGSRTASAPRRGAARTGPAGRGRRGRLRAAARRERAPDAPQLARLLGGDRATGCRPCCSAATPGCATDWWCAGRTRASRSRSSATRPGVDASVDPVVVVDAEAFAAAGSGGASPTRCGRSARARQRPRAVRRRPRRRRVATPTSWTPAATRRSPSGLVRLAVASSVLLLLLAVARRGARGGRRGARRARSRSGGCARSGSATATCAGSWAASSWPRSLVAALAGLVAGRRPAPTPMFGSLSLERITGQPGRPRSSSRGGPRSPRRSWSAASWSSPPSSGAGCGAGSWRSCCAADAAVRSRQPE